MTKINSMQHKQAFTLVELIVVITILAILATVGFVSFSGYLAWARDTNRIAQLKSMSDALELYRTKKDLPIPDDKVDVQASGSTIAYQWYIWANVLETIEYTEKWLDPKDKWYFSYYLTKDKKHFQLLSFLEEESEDVLANVFNETQAVDYEERVPHVKWKKLWILTDENNTPIQDVNSVISNGYLDIQLETNIYKAVFSDQDILSWTWETLEILKVSSRTYWAKNCLEILEARLASGDKKYSIFPQWEKIDAYCNMSNDWWGWTLVWVSADTSDETPQDILDAYIWNAPDDMSDDSIYSLDASDIVFSEVSMWHIWIEKEYLSFRVWNWFDNSRAFESENGWPETCVNNELYYSYNKGESKYWKNFNQFQESLITNRRDTGYWWVDLSTHSSCQNSYNWLAFYRWGVDSHSCHSWNCNTTGWTYTNSASVNNTPSIAEMDTSKIPEAIRTWVWLMVR